MLKLPLAACLSLAAAIQIKPNHPTPAGSIKGLCGSWKYGLPPAHPPCRPLATGGPGVHYEQQISNPHVLGPEATGAEESISFTQSKTTANNFVWKTTLWTDAPCFTRKPMCSAWDATKHKCPAGKTGICPSYQKHVGQEKSCGKVPGPGTAPYCFGSACKPTACRDEEFYPGCGALNKADVVKSVKNTDTGKNDDLTKNGGVKHGEQVEELTMSGVYVSLFDDTNIKKISDQTCDVLCPCKTKKAGCVFDLAGYRGYGKSKCSAEDVAAHTDCIAAYKTKNAPQWANMYSTTRKYGSEYSTPVMFQMDSIKVVPKKKSQVDYLKVVCPCGGKTWAIGSSVEISKCTMANCPYLGVKGMFAITNEPNCPKDKHCLFASVYKHDGIFLYISRMESTYASSIMSPIYSDGVYTLTGGDCVSAASTLQSSAMFVGVLALVVSLWQR